MFTWHGKYCEVETFLDRVAIRQKLKRNRMKQTKIDILFKAQTREMTPYLRENQKLKIALTAQRFHLNWV